MESSSINKMKPKNNHENLVNNSSQSQQEQTQLITN
jgi:hypothetical protein